MTPLWFWDSTLELTKREWCYVQPPNTYCMSGCTVCGNTDVQWSEYAKHNWCPKCEIDFLPEHIGIFDGPIPIATSAMLGIFFDRINLKTNEVEPFELDRPAR
jgi:hypothetical protein